LRRGRETAGAEAGRNGSDVPQEFTSIGRHRQIGSNGEHAPCFPDTGMNVHAKGGELCGRKVTGNPGFP
jgi:hypothetical protein